MSVVQIVVTIFLVIFTIGLVRALIQPFKKDKDACQKCEGKGYWLGARGREQCDWCKGSGKEVF